MPVKAIRAAVVLSVVLFMIACTETCFYTGDSRTPWGPGWYLLLIGPSGLLMGDVSWFANPSLILAWALLFFGPGSAPPSSPRYRWL
jgi:hypothetical protein